MVNQYRTPQPASVFQGSMLLPHSQRAMWSGDPIYWALEYSDGNILEEPAENTSILGAKDGAIRLLLFRADTGQGVARWELIDDDGLRWRPIFYRTRQGSYGPKPTLMDGAPDHRNPLYATVAGIAREIGSRIDAKLFLVYPSGEVQNCPPIWYEQTAIEMQTRRTVSG